MKTILYRPVLIETAEQAEALPEETIAYLLHEDGFTDGIAMRLPQSVADPRAWQVMGQFALNTHARMRGWTALVPIEAEEETRLHIVRSGARTTTADLTRLVTPWEEA